MLPVWEAVARGESPIYLGRSERTLQTLASVNRRVTGRSGQALFAHGDLGAQRDYLARKFPQWRWRLVLALLGNSTVLNSLLYKGEFPRKNIQGSTYGIYRDLFARLFQNTLAKTSFFLQMVFLGRLQYQEGFPLSVTRAFMHPLPKPYAGEPRCASFVAISLNACASWATSDSCRYRMCRPFCQQARRNRCSIIYGQGWNRVLMSSCAVTFAWSARRIGAMSRFENDLRLCLLLRPHNSGTLTCSRKLEFQGV